MKAIHHPRKINHISIVSLLACFAVFMSVFNKTVFSTVSIACVYVSILFVVLYIHGLFLCRWDILILYLFYTIPFLWITVSAINCFIMGSGFIDFFPSTIGRMSNCLVYLCMYLVIRFVYQKDLLRVQTLLSVYSYGCIVLLIFGWWQFAHYILGIPFLNIETRNYIHSMGMSTGIGFRVTSIMEEPAYLVPYMIDLFIIVFYKVVHSLSKKSFVRNILLIGIIGLLVFTLSLSAYCNFSFILLLVFLFMRRTKRKFVFGGILTIFSILIVILGGNIVFSVMKRLDLEQLLASDRLQEGYLPIMRMLSDSSPFTLLFGYGPKGFDYMRQFVFYVTGWQTGKPIAVTSHVIFIDFFVEYGLIGLVLLVGLFCLLWSMATSVYRYGGGRFVQLLVANLLICCFYTADYASPRFTILVAIVVCLQIENKRRYFYENICHNSNL